MVRDDVKLMINNVSQVTDWVGQADMVDDSLALMAETLSWLDHGLLDHSLPAPPATAAAMELRRLVSDWLLPAQTALARREAMPPIPQDEVRRSLRSLQQHLERLG